MPLIGPRVIRLARPRQFIAGFSWVYGFAEPYQILIIYMGLEKGGFQRYYGNTGFF